MFICSYYTEDINPDVPLNFWWLINAISSKTVGRMLIFFRNIDHIGAVYDFVTTNIGQSASTANKTVYMYHRGTKEQRRREIIEELSTTPTAKECKVVLCSSSFSLGLNLSAIVHFGCPDNVTEYIQETGRAARERNSHGHAILLTYPRMLSGGSKSPCVKAYAKTKECRRKMLMDNFGIVPDSNQLCCDNCVLNLGDSCPLIKFIKENFEVEQSASSRSSSGSSSLSSWPCDVLDLLEDSL